MRKFILLFSIITLIVSCCSGEKNIAANVIKGNGIIKEEIREIEHYQSITLKGAYDIILTDEPQGKIRIVGEENINPIVQAKVENGNLIISTKCEVSYHTQKKNVAYVPAQNISVFNLKGSGDIENEGNINVSHLQISLSGSGDIKLRNIMAERADISLIGSGDIDLSGDVAYISTLLKGSGDISAFHLITKDAKTELQGSGNINIFATESFVGELRGSGDIKVKGNPKKVSKNIKGSGEIRIL